MPVHGRYGEARLTAFYDDHFGSATEVDSVHGQHPEAGTALWAIPDAPSGCALP
jgi:hypothetical protein